MATTKKAKAVRRPTPADPKESPDAPRPAVMSGARAPRRVVPPPVVPDPEVRERAARRRFTAEYKLQILRQADQCRRGGSGRTDPAGGPVLLAPHDVAPAAGAGRARGPGSEEARPADGVGSPLARRVAELERDNTRLGRRLHQAEAIIEAQKKLSEILGLSAPMPGEAGSIG